MECETCEIENRKCKLTSEFCLCLIEDGNMMTIT